MFTNFLLYGGVLLNRSSKISASDISFVILSRALFAIWLIRSFLSSLVISSKESWIFCFWFLIFSLFFLRFSSSLFKDRFPLLLEISLWNLSFILSTCCNWFLVCCPTFTLDVFFDFDLSSISFIFSSISFWTFIFCVPFFGTVRCSFICWLISCFSCSYSSSWWILLFRVLIFWSIFCMFSILSKSIFLTMSFTFVKIWLSFSSLISERIPCKFFTFFCNTTLLSGSVFWSFFWTSLSINSIRISISSSSFFLSFISSSLFSLILKLVMKEPIFMHNFLISTSRSDKLLFATLRK